MSRAMNVKDNEFQALTTNVKDNEFQGQQTSKDNKCQYSIGQQLSRTIHVKNNESRG